MSKGGARARSGPAPDPNALRRERDSADWVTLPADGRIGLTPTWPLGNDIAAAKARLENAEQAEREADEKTAGRIRLVAEAKNELYAAEARAERESELWVEEWKRPQAVEWERNHQELEVAMYVRSFVVAEQPDAKVTARTLVRQQQEALGLSLPGLARNHWKIEAPKKEAGHATSAPSRSAARKRKGFRVLTGGE